MNLEALVIWSLVTWRITALIVYDGITAPVRDRIGVRYDEHSQPYGTNIVASLISCHKCTSVWVGLAICAFILHLTGLELIFTALALSGGSIIINKWVNGE